MVEVEIFSEKTLEENAALYHEKAKKARRKLSGLEQALKKTKQRIAKAKAKSFEEQEKARPLKKREKKWFERFRWFYSSDGMLVIGGRDSGMNEDLVKKHEEKHDVHLHCDRVASPHVAIKTLGKKPSEKTLQEAAAFTAAFSSAWKHKDYRVEVYSVKPGQLSKKAPTGEYLTKGAFIVKGERKWYKRLSLEAGIGIKKQDDTHIVISGPIEPVKKDSIVFAVLVPGEEKPSSIAKKLRELFKKKTGTLIDLDEIIRMLPPGNSRIKK